MKHLLATIFFVFKFSANAQEIVSAIEDVIEAKAPGEKPEGKFSSHPRPQVLTTGDHPLDDQMHNFSKSEPRQDGSVCIEKTTIVEKMERQQIKECWHQRITACHFSTVTEFRPQQLKKCEENTFHKTCKISFKEVALNYTVRTCHKPLVQQCSYRHHNQIPVTKCRTWFETTCNTTLVVDAYGSPKGGQQAWCEKIPKKICAPDHCAMVEGPEECLDKNIYSTMMRPEEFCDLQPTTDCEIVTNLVPHLNQREICEDVPKEFCHTKMDSPKMVRKPITMLWCTFPNATDTAAPSKPRPTPPQSEPTTSPLPNPHSDRHYYPQQTPQQSETTKSPLPHPHPNKHHYPKPDQPSYRAAAGTSLDGIEHMRFRGLKLLRKSPEAEENPPADNAFADLLNRDLL